jgi:hypothetical protein
MLNAILQAFTSTNIIPLWMVWMCIAIGIIGCLVSIYIFWIGFITLAIDVTILWDFLFNAKVVTGYAMNTANQIITLVETFEGLRLFCVILLIISMVCIFAGIFNQLSD